MYVILKGKRGRMYIRLAAWLSGYDVSFWLVDFHPMYAWSMVDMWPLCG